MTNQMKALTIWQPWAWLVAAGHKRFETRGWSTKYRGPLVIHSAKRKVKFAEWNDQVSATVLGAAGLADLNGEKSLFLYGHAIAIAELVDVIPASDVLDEIEGTPEYWFGNFTPGRYAWELRNVRLIAEPVAAKGMQGLWNWPSDVALRGVQS